MIHYRKTVNFLSFLVFVCFLLSRICSDPSINITIPHPKEKSYFYLKMITLITISNHNQWKNKGKPPLASKNKRFGGRTKWKKRYSCIVQTTRIRLRLSALNRTSTDFYRWGFRPSKLLEDKQNRYAECWSRGRKGPMVFSSICLNHSCSGEVYEDSPAWGLTGQNDASVFMGKKSKHFYVERWLPRGKGNRLILIIKRLCLGIYSICK